MYCILQHKGLCQLIGDLLAEIPQKWTAL